jgi:hypothetical protein
MTPIEIAIVVATLISGLWALICVVRWLRRKFKAVVKARR